MEIDFIIGIGLFVFMIAAVMLYTINYFSGIGTPTEMIEYRDKAISILGKMFSETSGSDILSDPRVSVKLYRIPILVTENSGIDRTNEPFFAVLNFDRDCEGRAWNNTIRVYDENFTEVLSRLSYNNFCSDHLLRNSTISLKINISANEKKRFFVYYSNNSEILAPNYTGFDLMAYYTFDEGTGTLLKDYSGFENNGTLKNGTNTCYNNDCPTWVNGKFSYGLQFDGINDYVDCGDVGTVKTIEFWIKTNTLTEDILQLNSSVNVSVSEGTISANGFSSPTIYVNGAEGSTLTTQWSHVAITTNSGINANEVKLGAVGTSYFNGTIDEVRIWNRVLTTDEILIHNASHPLDIKLYPEETISVISHS
ncbi:MAG: LamG-like jellyroll fold domain-containing protein, partial [Candidatus Aenigmatarchaeota archaeon]